MILLGCALIQHRMCLFLLGLVVKGPVDTISKFRKGNVFKLSAIELWVRLALLGSLTNLSRLAWLSPPDTEVNVLRTHLMCSLSPLPGLGCPQSSSSLPQSSYYHELGPTLPAVFSAEWIFRSNYCADPFGRFPQHSSCGFSTFGSWGVPLPGGSRMGGSRAFHAGQ